MREISYRRRDLNCQINPTLQRSLHLKHINLSFIELSTFFKQNNDKYFHRKFNALCPKYKFSLAIGWQKICCPVIFCCKFYSLTKWI